MITPDDQEALSRKYSDDVILLLPLTSGRIAVFNNARELCGFINVNPFSEILQMKINEVWHSPAAKPAIDLTELGLL